MTAQSKRLLKIGEPVTVERELSWKRIGLTMGLGVVLVAVGWTLYSANAAHQLLDIIATMILSMLLVILVWANINK